MPYEDAITYRFNPFDLTKISPHSDYPLIKVGTMTLNKNPDNFFAQIEQAAFEPSALVPGIGFSRQVLLGRVFAYSDTHRYRIGPNYLQLPVEPAGVNTYMFDGPMAFEHSGDARYYAPNTQGRAYSDLTGPVEDGWDADGEMVRTAYHSTPRTTTSARPGTWCVRSGTTSAASSSSTPSRATCLGGVAGVLERALGTGRAWTATPASGSRRPTTRSRSKYLRSEVPLPMNPGPGRPVTDDRAPPLAAGGASAYPCGPPMSTIHSTPNRSTHMPNSSPHSCLSIGTTTVPPSESLAQ